MHSNPVVLGPYPTGNTRTSAIKLQVVLAPTPIAKSPADIAATDPSAVVIVARTRQVVEAPGAATSHW